MASRSAFPSTGYLPTLDGWRAVAVFSVMAYHDKLHRIGELSDSWLQSQGSLGVDLFFAISGILICSRLLDDEEKTGRISLRGFYIRRTFRIVPPMLGYLVAVAVLGIYQTIPVDSGAWIASLLFVVNYFVAITHATYGTRYVFHFWSLAVEEHFYLLLPSMLKFRPQKRLKLLGFMTTGFLAWSLASTVFTRNDPFRDYADHRTDMRIFELFLPALMAILIRYTVWKNVIVRFCHPWAALLFVCVAGCVGSIYSHTFAYRLVVPIGFPFLILSTTFHPESWVGKFLEWPLLRALGRISFSIYLWQQLFFIGDAQPANGLLGFLQTGPWNLMATLGVATVSYFALEKPMMRLGHKLSPPSTPGHRDLDAYVVAK